MAKLEGTTPAQARKRCAGALVGKGTGKALVTMPGQAPFKISSPLSFFNAPPTGGKPTLIAHAYETVPAPKTLLVPIVIERVSQGPLRLPRPRSRCPKSPAATAPPTLAEATIGATCKRGGKKVGFIERPLLRRAAAGRRHADLHQRRLLPGDPDLAMPRPRLSAAARSLRCLAAGGCSSPAAPPAAPWSKSTTSSCAPTAASSRRRCRATSFAPIDFQGHVDISRQRRRQARRR